MTKYRDKPFHLLLIPVFFCLHGWAENFDFISFGDILLLNFQVVLSFVIFAVVLRILLKDLLSAALLTSIGGVFYLFFGAIKDALAGTLSGSYTFLLPLFLLLLIIFFFFIRSRKPLLIKLTRYFNLLFFVLVVIDLASCLGHSFNSKKQVTSFEKVPVNEMSVSDKPDVYFLLYDEYAGYKTLRDSFGFKNDLFYDRLSHLGFSVGSTFSNYNKTPFSMASIFNMDYVKDGDVARPVTTAVIQDRYKEIQEARVFDIFKSLGYEVRSYSVFTVTGNKPLSVNSFILNSNRLIVDKMLHNRVIKDLGWWFVTGRHAVKFFQNIYYGDIRHYNETVEEKVLASLNPQVGKPRLIYGHFFLPHHPYFYDSLGRPNEGIDLLSPAVKIDKGRYLSYLKYSNKQILNVARRVVETNPSAIVVIMSDHGFRELKNDKNTPPLAFDNLCAIRLPNGNREIPFPRSGVNLFRYLLNAGYHQRIPFLKDSVVLF
ncbi:sulfatase-like hydrolase/transferase [Niabella aurantiaca]|uniref:sulfatase-like hydrolase/transferase n=1 Tax=Niabella aurantiaca TaxID=379900 RepID=UPI000361B658|nr:sulfatase-like hydrolase/transferase [Niabella aurantiaca]